MNHAELGRLPELFTWLLSAAMLVVVWRDAERYIIPNHLNLAILTLFVAGLWVLPIYPMSAVVVAIGVFIVGFGLFSLGLMGGGDVKLLAVLSLWAGWPTAGTLLFLTAIFGGILVVIILLMRFLLPPLWFKCMPTRNLPRILTRKESIPYGIAIAASFLYLLWTKGIPALAHSPM